MFSDFNSLWTCWDWLDEIRVGCLNDVDKLGDEGDDGADEDDVDNEEDDDDGHEA